MSYIDVLARDLFAEISSDRLPDGDTDALFRIYAVLALAKGERVSVEDVHDAWCAWMSGENPDHPSLVPSSDLAPDVAAQDEPYAEVIRAVARAHGLTGRD